MYDPPLISIINRFDLSIHQSLMKISGVPVTFHGLFSHKLKNKRVSFIRSSRVNRMSQEERSLWNNKIFKRGLIHFKFSFPLPMSVQFSSVQFSSVSQSCPTLCDPIDCSTPGLPVHHQLLEFTQTLVHWVGDAIQPSHPLSSPSPSTFNLSQCWGLFKWVSSSHQVAKYWSFSFSIRLSSEYSGLISFRMDWLDLLQSKGLSKSLL